MSGTEYWDTRRHRILTRKGGWQIGRGVSLHGHSLLGELVGGIGFFELLILSVTGRRPEPRLARWIEGSFMCLSFPDPRIWCNHIGALGGSARCSAVASITAGVMASDSSLYGPGTTRAACEFLLSARAAITGGETPTEFIARHTTRTGRVRAPGFIRPIARGDERVDTLVRLSRQLGFEDGPHVQLAWQLDAVLRTRSNESLTILGYLVAFLLDRGFAIEEGLRIYSLSVNAGVHACFSEAADEPPGSFLPLCVEDIEYSGPPPRVLERNAAQ